MAAEPEERLVSRPPLPGLESLDVGCMLLWKVGTGSREASHAGEMRGREKRKFRSEPHARGPGRSSRPKKKSRPVPGTAQVAAWNLIPQRPCTAVTLFAAITQDRQQTVDSSVTWAAHRVYFRTPTRSRDCKHPSAGDTHRYAVSSMGMEQGAPGSIRTIEWEWCNCDAAYDISRAHPVV
jgi:hypothetical protein